MLNSPYKCRNSRRRTLLLSVSWLGYSLGQSSLLPSHCPELSSSSFYQATHSSTYCKGGAHSSTSRDPAGFHSVVLTGVLKLIFSHFLSDWNVKVNFSLPPFYCNLKSVFERFYRPYICLTSMILPCPSLLYVISTLSQLLHISTTWYS